jgi:hypothetical protein
MPLPKKCHVIPCYAIITTSSPKGKDPSPAITTMLILNLPIPNRAISLQTPKRHTPTHTNGPPRSMSSIPDSLKSPLRPRRQRRKRRQRGRIRTAARPQFPDGPQPPKPSLSHTLKPQLSQLSQLGSGRWRRNCRQRCSIWTAPQPQAPNPSLVHVPLKSQFVQRRQRSRV